MGKRTYTSAAIDRQVERQGHHCPYCTLPFGTVIAYRGETVQTPVGDHFAPYSWHGETRDDNLIASCQVCNSLKSARLFASVEHARRVLLVERMNRHIDTLFLPTTPITQDAEAWSREYARYLSSNGL